MNAAAARELLKEVQRLALTGYGADCSRHFILKVIDAAAARRFIAELLYREWICHSASKKLENQPLAGGPGNPVSAVNIGFTYRGLEQLQLASPYLEELRAKAPAFAEGAKPRAAQHLGDTGASAADGWEPAFGLHRAHLLLTIHADDEPGLEAVQKQLRELPGAAGLAGWKKKLDARHLSPPKKSAQKGKPDAEERPKNEVVHEGEQNAGTSKVRFVHFGFRDGIGMPVIEDKPRPQDQPVQPHQAGELLLGHPNDEGFNRWKESSREGVRAKFFHHGSFAAFRKIEQHEGEFRRFIERKVAELGNSGIEVSADYLKAKLCGRWPIGARIMPGETERPGMAPDSKSIDDFNFEDDENGFGCPFGAHIRRTNPRGDPTVQQRRRPLFRRGMPYGPPYEEKPEAERGLLGLFFCASLEDQFEHVMAHWVDKVPMGPDNRGRAKDPLIGEHDDPAAVFHIPRDHAPAIELKGFAPFVTTRGTLYAFYPSLWSLRQIADEVVVSVAAPVAAAPPAQRAARPGAAAKPADDGERREPRAEQNNAPKDRYCDIVMEGGVTSGVIYSWAVAELANDYRFQRIGGTSIGAFAAAVTAAAEYQRRRGSSDGYKSLIDLPAWLADTDGDRQPTRLQRMFRAEPQTQRLFEIFLATLDRKTYFGRLGAGTWEAVRQCRGWVLLAVALTFVLVLLGPLALAVATWLSRAPTELKWAAVVSLAYSLPLAAALSIAAAIVVVAILIGHDLLCGLVRNGFGICRGGPMPDEDPAAPTLTLAMHSLIQTTAGRKTTDPPLTFEDLWTAPGFPPPWLHDDAGSAGRSIDLHVYATNLTHGRPYRFPFDEDDGMSRLFFKADELMPYFPPALLGHLIGHAERYRPKTDSDPPFSDATRDLLELPRGKLPIAVAARLSLSFPLLISAVPLWAIDYEPKGRENRLPRRCWFADGGLCSNFPIHLFDSFVPEWPTFGISLHQRSKYREHDPVWLPEKHYEGGGDTRNREIETDDGNRSLIGFLVSLWTAAWRWNDSTTMRMPGVRDRVVRVLLRPGEGGVNIKMTAGQIRNLPREYGLQAAIEFHKKFIDGPGWHEHRWVRFNTLLVALRERVQGISEAMALDRYSIPLPKQITGAAHNAPLRGPKNVPPSKLRESERPLNAAQVRELKLLLAALKRLEARFQAASDHEPYVPEPRPRLRIRHPT